MHLCLEEEKKVPWEASWRFNGKALYHVKDIHNTCTCTNVEVSFDHHEPVDVVMILSQDLHTTIISVNPKPCTCTIEPVFIA